VKRKKAQGKKGMEKPMSRKEQNKKIQIYNAIIELVEEGFVYSNMRISDIASRAGIGKGTVYEYFESKEQIFSNMVMFLIYDITEEFNNYQLNTDLPYREMVIDFIVYSIKLIEKNEKIYSIVYSSELKGKMPELCGDELKVTIEEAYNSYFRQVQEVVSIGMENGKIGSQPDPFNVFIAGQLIIGTMVSGISNNIVRDMALQILTDSDVTKEDVDIKIIADKLSNVFLSILN
jgi:AcrR family transcriptional regulator